MKDEYTYDQIYKDTEYHKPIFHIYNKNPLYRWDLETNKNPVEQTISAPNLPIPNSESNPIQEYIESYHFLFHKWKYFTLGLCIAISTSYILGFIVEGKYERYEPSYNSKVIVLRMITHWPECQDKRHELWRLITCIFSHANLNHFTSNIMGIVLFSFMLELYQDWRYILPLFLIGVIHGNLSFYYAKPYYGAIGVSQGVFALVGMNAANGIINAPVLPRLQSLIIFYFCITTLIGEAISYDESNNIAYICHWGSLISGFLGGMSLLKQYKPTIYLKYTSYCFVWLYLGYSIYLMYHYTFEWPPLQSYTNTLQPIETNDCCYEWLKYQYEMVNATRETFACKGRYTSSSYYKAIYDYIDQKEK